MKETEIQDWHDADCIQALGRDPCDCNYGKKVRKTKDKMELSEVKREGLLIFRHYLIVCYRSGEPCSYQVWDGEIIATNTGYFEDGEDANGNKMTYKFFILPPKVR
jgi:hypothetical protein